MGAMSVAAGVGIVAAVIAILLGCCYVWRNAPFPCPNCESLDTQVIAGVPGAFCRCSDCGHEWR